MLKKPEVVSLVEEKNEGFISLLNKVITVYCSAYIYSGKLEGVNDTCIKLTGTKIVYDTGSFSTKDWATAEKFPQDGEWYIQLSAIESFGVLKS